MKPRNYRAEYRYQGTRRQKRRRAIRNAARRKMIRAGRARKGDGKDVGHVKGIGAGNGFSNLRIQSRHKNRSYNRNRKGGVVKHPA